MDMTAAAERRRLKAEVQRRIEAREITESEADDLLDCLVREAKLGPRPVDDLGAIWRTG
jgi:hypothetical protein